MSITLRFPVTGNLVSILVYSGVLNLPLFSVNVDQWLILSCRTSFGGRNNLCPIVTFTVSDSSKLLAIIFLQSASCVFHFCFLKHVYQPYIPFSRFQLSLLSTNQTIKKVHTSRTSIILMYNKRAINFFILFLFFYWIE